MDIVTTVMVSMARRWHVERARTRSCGREPTQAWLREEDAIGIMPTRYLNLQNRSQPAASKGPSPTATTVSLLRAGRIPITRPYERPAPPLRAALFLPGRTQRPESQSQCIAAACEKTTKERELTVSMSRTACRS